MGGGGGPGGPLEKSNSLPSLGKADGDGSSKQLMSQARYVRILRQRREERHLLGRKDELMGTLARARCNIPVLDFTSQASNKLLRKNHMRYITEACAPLLKQANRQTLLTLDEHAVGDDGAAALALILPFVNSLTHVNLARNGISDRGGAALAAAVRKDPTIHVLNLAHNELSAGVCVQLSAAMQVNKSLQKLVLRGNQLMPEGARLLAPGAMTSRTLRELNLRSCGVRDAGAAALADSVTAATPLTRLDLSHNDITGEGARALARALAVTRSLTDLNMCDNAVKGEAAAVLADAVLVSPLQMFSQLSVDGLRKDGVSHVSVKCMAPGAHVIARLLGSSRSLRQINFHGCHLDDMAVRALARALEQNTSLQELGLAGNDDQHVVPPEVCSAGGRAVCDVLRATAESATHHHGVAAARYNPGGNTGGVELRRVKWMFLGRGEAGKSSLYQTLKNETTTLRSEADRTIGLDVDVYKPDHAHGLKVSVWDYAGQEVYWRVGNSMYLTERRTLYVLLFDASCSPPKMDSLQLRQLGNTGGGVPRWSEDTEMEWIAHWVRLLLVHAPGAAVQLVAAKSDLVADSDRGGGEGGGAGATLQRRMDLATATFDRVVELHRRRVRRQLEDMRAQLDEMGVHEQSLRRRREGRRASKVAERIAALQAEVDTLEKQLSRHLKRTGECLSCSCKDYAGVAALGKSLLSLCENPLLFPDLHNVVPKSWGSLLDRVEAMQEDEEEPGGFSWEAFRARFLDSLGFSSGESFEAAAEFLHDVGGIMRYSHEPALREMVVVKPQWLIDVFKQVIRTDFNQLTRRHKWAHRLVVRLQTLGELDGELLKLLWGQVHPPVGPELRQALLRLMLAFEVVLPAQPDMEAPVHLVPSYFPHAPGKMLTELWPTRLEAGEAVLGVMVHLEPCPQGFFERLLVRTREVFQLQPGAWRGGVGSLGGIDAGAVFLTPRLPGCTILVRVDSRRMMVVARMMPSRAEGWFSAAPQEGAAAAAVEARWMMDEAVTLLSTRFPGVAHVAELLCCNCLSGMVSCAHRPMHALDMRKVPILAGGWDVAHFREQKTELQLALAQHALREGRIRKKEQEAARDAQERAPMDGGLRRLKPNQRRRRGGGGSRSPSKASSPEPPLQREMLDVLESAVRCKTCGVQERSWVVYDVLSGDARMDPEFDAFLSYRKPYEPPEDATAGADGRGGGAADKWGLQTPSTATGTGERRGSQPQTPGGWSRRSRSEAATPMGGDGTTPTPGGGGGRRRSASISAWDAFRAEDAELPGPRDQEVAVALFSRLERRLIRPFIDVRCTRPGSLWGKAAVKALLECSTFIPLVSVESVRALRRVFSAVGRKAERGSVVLEDHKSTDAVLAEYIIALELRAIGLIHTILPVYTGGTVPLEFLPSEDAEEVRAQPEGGGGGEPAAGGIMGMNTFASVASAAMGGVVAGTEKLPLREVSRLSSYLPNNVVPTRAIEEAHKILANELREYGIPRPRRWRVLGATDGQTWSLRGILEALVYCRGEEIDWSDGSTVLVQRRNEQIAREIERRRVAEGGGRRGVKGTRAKAVRSPMPAGEADAGKGAGEGGGGEESLPTIPGQPNPNRPAEEAAQLTRTLTKLGRGVLSPVEVASIQLDVLARVHVVETKTFPPTSGELYNRLSPLVTSCAAVVMRAHERRAAMLAGRQKGMAQGRITLQPGENASPLRLRRSLSSIQRDAAASTANRPQPLEWTGSFSQLEPSPTLSPDPARTLAMLEEDYMRSHTGPWEDSAHEMECVWAILLNVRPQLDGTVVASATDGVAEQTAEDNRSQPVELLQFWRDLGAEQRVTSANHPGMVTSVMASNMSGVKLLVCASLEEDHIVIMARGQRRAEALAAVGARELQTRLERLLHEAKLHSSTRLVCTHCLREAGRMRPGWTGLDIEDVGVFPMREISSAVVNLAAAKADSDRLACKQCFEAFEVTRGLHVITGQYRAPKRGRVDAVITHQVVAHADLVEDVFLAMRHNLFVPFWALREGLGGGRVAKEADAGSDGEGDEGSDSASAAGSLGDEEDAADSALSAVVEAMSRSTFFMPVICSSSFDKMTLEARSRETEGVLLEWVLAMAFHEAGMMEYIMPIYPEEKPPTADDVAGHLQVPESTLERASDLLKAVGKIDVQQKVPDRLNIRTMVARVMKWPPARLVANDMDPAQAINDKIIGKLNEVIRVV